LVGHVLCIFRVIVCCPEASLTFGKPANAAPPATIAALSTLRREIFLLSFSIRVAPPLVKRIDRGDISPAYIQSPGLPSILLVSILLVSMYFPVARTSNPYLTRDLDLRYALFK